MSSTSFSFFILHPACVFCITPWLTRIMCPAWASSVSAMDAYQLSQEYACPSHKCNPGLIQPPSPTGKVVTSRLCRWMQVSQLLQFQQDSSLRLPRCRSSWPIPPGKTFSTDLGRGTAAFSSQNVRLPLFSMVFCAKYLLYFCMPLVNFQDNQIVAFVRFSQLYSYFLRTVLVDLLIWP